MSPGGVCSEGRPGRVRAPREAMPRPEAALTSSSPSPWRSRARRASPEGAAGLDGQRVPPAPRGGPDFRGRGRTSQGARARGPGRGQGRPALRPRRPAHAGRDPPWQRRCRPSRGPARGRRPAGHDPDARPGRGLERGGGGRDPALRGGPAAGAHPGPVRSIEAHPPARAPRNASRPRPEAWT